jgi:uncharacterized protein YfaQ (DUF2300 family)
VTKALLALLLAAVSTAGADELSLAWLRDGRVETRTAAGHDLPAAVPLGSLWKLWVYAYAVDQELPTPVYRCATTPRPGDEYCCEPGGAVERDQALARSCGLFFEPARLGIDAAAWRAYWQGRGRADGVWIESLERLQPDTHLTVPQVLRGIEAIAPPGRDAASRALLPVLIDGYGQGAASELGGMVRVKTFTWKHPGRAGASMGGGGGWLVDGTPIWFGGTGASRQVLRETASQLRDWLPAPREAAMDDACVVVDYFERYPLRAVDHLPSREPAAVGPLSGSFRALFANGHALTFESRGELRLDRDTAGPHVRGRLALSEYVARVVDREGDAKATEAARALAIVARTWVFQNAPFETGCYKVADSTRMQRVSANPSTAAALQAALFTHGLVLEGHAVRYQRDEAAAGVLAWTTAVAQAKAGQRFSTILATAFPDASLAAASGEQECRRLPEAHDWLARMVPQWRRRLAREPGFEPLAEPLTVCGLDYGNPYADRARATIHVRGLATREDRIAIAHEYVHLTFPHHPSGRDESFVERTARSLAE